MEEIVKNKKPLTEEQFNTFQEKIEGWRFKDGQSVEKKVEHQQFSDDFALVSALVDEFGEEKFRELLFQEAKLLKVNYITLYEHIYDIAYQIIGEAF